MEKLFLIQEQKEYTYLNLITDLDSKKDYSIYVYFKDNNPYKIFLHIIHSLLYNYSIVLLDGDMSELELMNIGYSKSQIEKRNIISKKTKVMSLDSLFEQITNNKQWTITIYTSGTTGRPKRVSHTFESLTRNILVKNEFKDNIWGFAYNPTHMAGLQVFFQAILNKNTIVYLFKEKPKSLAYLIVNYSITNISATSTFYRNTLPFLGGDIFPEMKRVTFGGEKYDPNLEYKINKLFPNAKIRNIYASTEVGSLFSSVGDVFKISEKLNGFIKITEIGELLVHKSLLGKSEAIQLDNDWYKTGDIVEKIDEVFFRFLSRDSELINVGGYKVNPTEVENVLITTPGVIDLVVKGRKNRVTGEILVLDVVKDPAFDAEELKKNLKKQARILLQEWKVPRVIKFVDGIQLTRTGKKVRG